MTPQQIEFIYEKAGWEVCSPQDYYGRLECDAFRHGVTPRGRTIWRGLGEDYIFPSADAFGDDIGEVVAQRGYRLEVKLSVHGWQASIDGNFETHEGPLAEVLYEAAYLAFVQERSDD